MRTVLLPLVTLVVSLTLAHRFIRYVPHRNDVPEPEPVPCTPSRTRVVLDEAYGYQHVDALSPRDLAKFLCDTTE